MAIGVGAALGCTLAYLVLFGGASEANPRFDIPVFDGAAVVVLCATALVANRVSSRHSPT